MKKFLCLLSFAVSLAAFAGGVAYTGEAPVINGSGDDPVWKKLSWNSGFTKYKTHEIPQADTRFKMAYDKENFYFLIEALEPSMNNLSIRESLNRTSETFWMNDTVEIIMVHDPALLLYHKILINPNGKIQEVNFGEDNTGRGIYTPFFQWKSHAVVKTKRLADRWTVECSVPIASLNPGKNVKWRFNINRNRHAGKGLEVTSWVKVNGSSQPAAYREFSLPEIETAGFQFSVDNISGKTSLNKAKQIVHEVSADLINLTGNFRIAQVRYELLDQEFRCLASNQKTVNLQHGKFSRVKLPLTNVKNGKYFLALSYWSLAGQLLKQTLVPTVIRYQPIVLKLIRPAYRNNIYATMPDKTIEAEISLDGIHAESLQIALKDQNGKVYYSKTHPGNALPVKVIIPGKDLPDGSYFLEVTAGKEHKRSLRIRKLPYLKGEVYLDAQGITHVDGTRFLPYGWFIFQNTDPKTEAFNSELNYGIGAKSMKNFYQWLQNYSDMGLKNIAFPYQEFNGKHEWKIFAHSTRVGGLRPDQKKHLEQYIPEMKKHPSILAWYFADEPESRGGNNPQWFVQAHELMQELDPYHPNLMLNWGIHGMQQFYEGCDILMPDCYIRYMADGSTEKPRWAISDWMKTATSLGKTVWLVPQVFLWGNAAPTFNDYRSEIYQALIHNCKGFQLYNFAESRLHSTLTVAPDAVGMELLRMKDLVLENTIPGAVSVQTPKGAEHFQAGLKFYKGEYVLIAVNTSLMSFDADFTVNGNLPGELHVLGEKRSVKLNGGKFRDHFGPAETHVYLSSKTRADSVEDLASIHSRIARMKADRKKPGNKVALGEIDHFRIYREWEQGKRPAHVAEIKGSSDLGSWFTIHMYKMSTFYFLFDGVTDHSSDLMIWGPAWNDNNPWIEITLPKEETISKAVLYTVISQNGKARMTDAMISYYNGKEYVPLKAVSSRNGSRIELKFPAVKTQKIRLSGFKVTPGEPRKILTEIEIY